MEDIRLFTLVFTGVWCLVGGVFLCVALGLRRSFLRREERLRARAAGTVTEVVRRVHHGKDGASANWYPIVTFEADGHEISLEWSEGGGPKRFWEGQSVEVLYDPDDPACFRLEGHSATQLLAKIFAAAGLVCIAVGLIVGLAVNGFSKGLKID